MEVAGVGGAKIFPLWNGAGTVKVVLVDADMEPASSEIVAVRRPNRREERPIGANVTVAARQRPAILVAAISPWTAVRPARGKGGLCIRAGRLSQDAGLPDQHPAV
jgi:uncharacterized phage protein gp47/JayE